ncbi:MAG: AI-2E family transporter [Acidobacteriota bacterium]
MDRGIFFALLYFSAVVVVVGLMLLLLWPFLGAIAWAAVLAMASQPLHRVLATRFPKRKNLNAVLTTSAVVLTVAIPLIILIVLFAGESVQVVAAIEKAVTQGKIPGREQVMANPHVAYWVNKLQPYFIGVDIKEAAIAGLKAASSLGVAFSKTIMKHTLSMVLKFFVMVLVLFFVVRDGEGIISGFWSVIPLKPRDKTIITQTVRRVVNAVLYGIVLTCVLQGILGGIGFAIVGLPSPAFFGAAMIVAAFIPVVGTAIVWVPAVLYLVAAGQYTQAVILLQLCAAVPHRRTRQAAVDRYRTRGSRGLAHIGITRCDSRSDHVRRRDGTLPDLP